MLVLRQRLAIEMQAQSTHGAWIAGSSCDDSSNLHLHLRRLPHRLPDGVRAPPTLATHSSTGSAYAPGTVRG